MDRNELLGLFEKLLSRVEMLPAEQKAFVMIFLNGQKYRTLAKAAGVNDATIARRLRKIAVRISSDNFLTALVQDSPVLREKFISGKTITQISRETGLSYYKVKKIIRTNSELSL
jgi:uncharacterized protein YerC